MPKTTNATPYSNQKNWSNTYLTDPELVRLLGPFETDPCCPPRMPWRTARRMYSHEPVRKNNIRSELSWQDGLKARWYGRVFMNPPYRGVLKWAQRFVQHGKGIALLNGRSTETRATQIIMKHAVAIWFPDRRLTFHKITGKPFTQKWFPSLLIGMHPIDAAKMRRAQKVYGGQIFIKKNQENHNG